MSILPVPIVRKHGKVLVIRDDYLEGGTKRRVIPQLLVGGKEFVYASPAQGYAQLALAYACRDYGYRATVFVAKRKKMHYLTVEASNVGAKIVEVVNGYLSVVTSKARIYCKEAGAVLLPFGLDDPLMIKGIAEIAKSLPVAPREVWSVASSGVLTRALQLAWPQAVFKGIRVGHAPFAGNAEILQAPERFEQKAKIPPPFPSCANYDAKVWQFIEQYATPGAIFWNVAG